jgi:hypothetical protein
VGWTVTAGTAYRTVGLAHRGRDGCTRLGSEEPVGCTEGRAPGGLVMVCRPWGAAGSEMGSENVLGTRMPRLGGAGVSKGVLRQQATRSTTPGTGRRRSAPPQRGCG